MWSVAHLCRCSAPLRGVQSKVFTRNGISYGLASRQLVTTSRNNANKFGISSLRVSHLVKSNSLVVRLWSSSPKPKQSKAVGYWLLGCSGMVFTAVVLGMVAGYVILLYSVYYVVDLVVFKTNGSK